MTLSQITIRAQHLAQIGQALAEVTSIEEAIEWNKLLNTWWQAYGHLTQERTRYRDGNTGFTHDRLRKAWNLLHHLNRKKVLFTYLEHGNGKTTSPLEGGINNGIRTMLRLHRGMSIEHMRRAAEWFLTLHEIPITKAHQFINHTTEVLAAAAPEAEEETPQVGLYDTGLDAGEGLWHRAGWAGRG